MPDFAGLRRTIGSQLSTVETVLKRASTRSRALSAEDISPMQEQRKRLASIQQRLPIWENAYPELCEASLATIQQAERDIEGGQHQSAMRLINAPIRRALASFSEFSVAAGQIKRERFEARMGLFGENISPLVVNSIACRFNQPPSSNARDAYERCLSDAGSATKWPVHLTAVLYWMAHKAEKLLMDALPAEPDEDFYNSRLLVRLDEAVRSDGRTLTNLLGYDSTVPFEIGLLETEKQKKTESNTGADFILIVYLQLENGGSHTCAVLIQGKMETSPYVTNIFREKTTIFTANHQIRALTAENRPGYYFVYPLDRERRPIIVDRAQDFLEQVRGNNTNIKDVSLLKQRQCYVQTDRDGIDLATFFGRELFKKEHWFGSVGDAVQSFGQPVTELGLNARETASILAKRLVLVEIGGRVPQDDMKLVEALGFKRKPIPEEPEYSGHTP